MSIEKLYYSDQLKSSIETMKEKLTNPITKIDWLQDGSYTKPEQFGFNVINALYDNDYLVLTESYNGLSGVTAIRGDGYCRLETVNPDGTEIQITKNKDTDSIHVYINSPDGTKNIISVRDDDFSAIIDKTDGNRYVYNNEHIEVYLDRCERHDFENKDDSKIIYADLNTGELLNLK